MRANPCCIFGIAGPRPNCGKTARNSVSLEYTQTGTEGNAAANSLGAVQYGLVAVHQSVVARRMCLPEVEELVAADLPGRKRCAVQMDGGTCVAKLQLHLIVCRAVAEFRGHSEREQKKDKSSLLSEVAAARTKPAYEINDCSPIQRVLRHKMAGHNY